VRKRNQDTDTVIRLVEAADHEGLVAILEHLNSAGQYPTSFLRATNAGLTSDDWSLWADEYREMNFLTEDHEFLLAAPYSAMRQGVKTVRLSALIGKVMEHDPIDIGAAKSVLLGLFGTTGVQQPLTRVLPVSVRASAGLLAREEGEAFVVPNGWPIEDGDGPALNNMIEQRRRFETAKRCVEKIFEPEAAELLLGPLSEFDQYVQVLSDEYQLHDFGHASGIGLMRMLKADVLRTPFLGGIEEWRADGVAFEIGQKVLPLERLERVFASNLITRFGLDAQRQGGLIDTDVNAALFTFTCLLDTGAITTGRHNQLRFTRSSLRDLLNAGATEFLRSEAIRLTRAEMAYDDPRSIWRLKGVDPSRAAETLFREHIVEPCLGAFTNLR
jgi:hypothetical protein